MCSIYERRSEEPEPGHSFRSMAAPAAWGLSEDGAGPPAALLHPMGAGLGFRLHAAVGRNGAQWTWLSGPAKRLAGSCRRRTSLGHPTPAGA